MEDHNEHLSFNRSHEYGIKKMINLQNLPITDFFYERFTFKSRSPAWTFWPSNLLGMLGLLQLSTHLMIWPTLFIIIVKMTLINVILKNSQGLINQTESKYAFTYVYVILRFILIGLS